MARIRPQHLHQCIRGDGQIALGRGDDLAGFDVEGAEEQADLFVAALVRTGDKCFGAEEPAGLDGLGFVHEPGLLEELLLFEGLPDTAPRNDIQPRPLRQRLGDFLLQVRRPLMTLMGADMTV